MTVLLGAEYDDLPESIWVAHLRVDQVPGARARQRLAPRPLTHQGKDRPGTLRRDLS